jgi:hypothetical protein
VADKPDDSNQPLRTDDLFTPRHNHPPGGMGRWWVNSSCPTPLMPAAPLVGLAAWAGREAYEEWLLHWLVQLRGHARSMELQRSRGAALLQYWDSRMGWMLDCGPLDPFRWAFYWRFWAGRSAVVAEYQARVDVEFAEFERFRDAPTGGWAVHPSHMKRVLDEAYACVDYSDWSHQRVPANRVEWAAWEVQRAATRRPVKAPNLYGPSQPGPKRPGR